MPASLLPRAKLRLPQLPRERVRLVCESSSTSFDGLYFVTGYLCRKQWVLILLIGLMVALLAQPMVLANNLRDIEPEDQISMQMERPSAESPRVTH